MKIGSLHVRITNVGKKSARLITDKPAMKESTLVYDYHQSAKLRNNLTYDAKKLSDVDLELHELLQSVSNDRIARLNLSDAQKVMNQPVVNDDVRRLQIMYKNLETDQMIPVSSTTQEHHGEFSYEATRAERDRDQKTVDIFRER